MTLLQGELPEVGLSGPPLENRHEFRLRPRRTPEVVEVLVQLLEIVEEVLFVAGDDFHAPPVVFSHQVSINAPLRCTVSHEDCLTVGILHWPEFVF